MAQDAGGSSPEPHTGPEAGRPGWSGSDAAAEERGACNFAAWIGDVPSFCSRKGVAKVAWFYALLVAAGLIPACRPSAQSRATVPLEVLADTLAICRLDRTHPLPAWATPGRGQFFSATRTRDELSIIVPNSAAPKTAKCERPWRAFRVRGTLDFNQVGIIAGLSGALAHAGVSIFALSTYDTDYVMVKQADFDRAATALRRAGYTVNGP